MRPETQMNLPNLLSMLRLLLISVFVCLFFSGMPHAYWYAAGVFLLSGLTDLLDGKLARKMHMETDLGRLLDPLADKLMQTAVFLCLWIAGIVPLWILLAFTLKEVLILLGGTRIYRKQETVVQSAWYGKIGTGIFYAVVAAILLFGERMGGMMELGLVMAALIWAIFAGVMYAVQYRAVMRGALAETRRAVKQRVGGVR